MAMATVIAALLIATRLMMTPFLALNAMDRTMLLDSLLTNGRSPLTLQLPMIVIWCLGMLHLFCFECFLCAALLKRCVHSLPYGLCSALTAALIFAMALFRLYDLPADFAMYEGLCRGPVLDGGDESLLMVSDGDGGAVKAICALRLRAR